MNTLKVSLGDIAVAEAELEHLQHEFLKERGWKYTNDNPGALWLWEKTIENGRTLQVDTAAALYMETIHAEISEDELPY